MLRVVDRVSMNMKMDFVIDWSVKIGSNTCGKFTQKN